MFVSACGIEEARRDASFLELRMELTRQGGNYAWLPSQRRHENAVARSFRVGG
jgi:hypothetical protein